jgi:fructose-bisphosphate aldolase, class II
MPHPYLKNNNASAILKAVEAGSYGLSSVVSVRLLSFHSSETLFATAASRPTTSTIPRTSWPLCARPTQILLFSWAIIYANGLLVSLVADAFHSVKVPITLYPNHAQFEDTIKIVAGCPFDNISVDMSHYEKEENLAKAKGIDRVPPYTRHQPRPILATWRMARTVSRIWKA